MDELKITISEFRSRAYSPRLEAGQPIPGYLYIVEKLAEL